MNFHGVDYEKYFLRTIYVSINKSETRTIPKTKKVDIYKKKLRKEYMRLLLLLWRVNWLLFVNSGKGSRFL